MIRIDLINFWNFPFNHGSKDALKQMLCYGNRTKVTHIKDQFYNFQGNILTANRGAGIPPSS